MRALIQCFYVTVWKTWVIKYHAIIRHRMYCIYAIAYICHREQYGYFRILVFYGLFF